MNRKRKPKLRVPRSVIEAIPTVVDLAYTAYTVARQMKCGHKNPATSKLTPPEAEHE